LDVTHIEEHRQSDDLQALVKRLCDVLILLLDHARQLVSAGDLAAEFLLVYKVGVMVVIS
jgi:hypothetical protein